MGRTLMKKASGIILGLALVLIAGLFMHVDAEAATLDKGLDFTSEATSPTGDGYSWDAATSTLTVTGLTINTIDNYGIKLPNGAKIVLDGDLSVTVADMSGGYGIYSDGLFSIVGTGDIYVENKYWDGISYNRDCLDGTLLIDIDGDITVNAEYGIYDYSTDEVLSPEDYGNVHLDLTLTGDLTIDSLSPIIAYGDVDLTSGGGVELNADRTAIMLAGENESVITFDVAGETKIKGYTGVLLVCDAIIVNNGAPIYITGKEEVDYDSTYGAIIYDKFNNEPRSLTVQGSGDIYTNNNVLLENLTLEGSGTFYANDGFACDDTVSIGADATLDTLGMEVVNIDVYGMLKAGVVAGYELSIYDGATVIIDYERLPQQDGVSAFPIALALTGDGEWVPSLTLGDQVALQTPEAPAKAVLTTMTDLQNDPDYNFYILTVTKDGKELDSETFGNVSPYIVFATMYDITVTATGEGSVTPDTSSIAKGEDVTYTFAPADGYEVSKILVDGVSVDVATSYTFKGVASNHTLDVVFTEIVVDDTTEEDKDDTTTDGGDKDDTTTDDKDDTTGEDKDDVDREPAVATGDSNDIALFVVLASVSALGCVVIKRREIWN